MNAGAKLGRYEIRSKLGAGGMGEVYLAQDTKLDRNVALKILPPDLAADRSRMNRFVLEAKAASALNHPNIITIYEIDDTDSGHFIATEFIEGETVRECLRQGPLKVSEALNVATQVAAALFAAHQTGIIHRDIKPENVMLRADGLVKVLDFGLAKLTAMGASDPDAATRISDTQPGMIMGTVGYMSPEQARGKTLDARTDIWSLGVLLYEMLSGRPPFRGETTSDTLANILHREPDTLNIGGLPADLATIVQKMLAKKLEARYPTIANVVSDLKSLQRRIDFDSELQQTTLRNSAEARTEIIESVETAADSASSRTDEGFWVAVLPFKYPGSNSDLEALSEGLSEDIVTGLSRFPHLKVIARSSTSRFSGASGDVRSIGKELGARYVLEGSLRQAGTMLRVTVQLLDAITGAHMWAETYNRDLNQSDIFSVQDDLTDRVVATVADSYGVLVRSMAASVEEKRENELTSSDWMLRQFRYRQLLTPEEHAKVRDGLERFVKREPKHAAPWACLAQLYVDEFVFKFNPHPDALDRALAAARRSVDLDRTFQYGNQILAQVHFFRRDTAAFRTTAEQAMSLNSRDTDTVAMMGLMLVHIGEFERGANIVRRAMDLNPNHAGWYHFAIIWEHLNKGDYEKALARITRVNMPGLFWQPLTVASICGLLERPIEAAAAVRELRKLDPDFEQHVREYIEVWHYSSGLMDRILEGLSKAGVEIATDPGPPSSSILSTASGERPTLEGFWVAVLPFKYRGNNPELEALAEELSEDIITGLSRFSSLRVIARSSTLRWTSESGDVRSLGKQLGARYVMDGSLRQAGAMLRLVVQLVDASTGAHLWAETYDRAIENEKIFAIQDDLVPRIVSTVADWYGVLTHSMSEAVRQKPLDQLSPYEALLRSFGYYERVTAEEHAAARSALERAVEQAPGNADGWAMLSMMYGEEFRFGFNEKPDAMGRSLQAARRAVEVAPSNHFAHLALAQALFFRKDFGAFRHAAERAIALNPMDGSTMEYVAHLIAFSGDWDYGCEVAERARQLNPNHPGWYWAVPFYNAYRQGDYLSARAFALRIDQPTVDLCQVMLAAVHGQLGEREAADKTVRSLLALTPDTARIRKQLDKWYQPELVKQIKDGLRKAGLQLDEEATPSSSPSIAVLPFANLSADAENEYFCEGLAEELLNALAKIDKLRVAARTSAFSFKGQNRNISEIAKTLNVSTVLEGSVRKSGNRVRITTQLINAADGYHLWSERYDREMKDIFDVQDEITVAVVEALKVKLLSREKSVILKRHTSDPDAYESYLRGLSHFNTFTPEGFQKAIESFNRAITIDPHYASAYAGLADAYTEMSFFSFSAHSEWMPKAEDAARKALELDDSLGEAHNSLAIIEMYLDWNYAGAEREFKRAIALNPGSALIQNWYGWYLALMGRFDESLNELQRARDLDPLSPTINSGVGIVFHWSRQPERAIEEFRKVLELNPSYSLATSFLAEAYVQKGDFALAIATVERLQQSLQDPLTLPIMGYVLAKSGEHQKARDILKELEKQAKREYVPSLNFAQIYAGLGDNEQALVWLNKACDERSVWMTFLKVDPKFDPLRTDTRFQDLLRRVGLPL